MKAALPGRLKSLLAVLALVAMLVRGVAPVGYMFAPSASGLITVTLCGGGAPVQLDLTTGSLRHGPADPSHDESKAHGHGPCLFAAAATMAGAPTQLALSAPLHRNIEPALRPVQASVGRGLAAPPPPARGPPLLV